MTLQERETQHFADSGNPDTEVIKVAVAAPVFVDATGRRRRLLRRAAYAFGALCMLYGGLVSVSLAGGPVSSNAVLPLPDLRDNEQAVPRPALTPAPLATKPSLVSEALRRPDAAPSTRDARRAEAPRATTSSVTRTPVARPKPAAVTPSPSPSRSTTPKPESVPVKPGPVIKPGPSGSAPAEPSPSTETPAPEPPIKEEPPVPPALPPANGGAGGGTATDPGSGAGTGGSGGSGGGVGTAIDAPAPAPPPPPPPAPAPSREPEPEPAAQPSAAPEPDSTQVVA